jgi:flagellar biosynthetic protein FliR
VLLLPPVIPLLPAAPVNAWQAAGMVVAELLAGFLLGWLARLVALALPMAGQIISAMTGLTSVLAPASDLGAQTTVLGKLFALAVPVLVFSSGLYALPISALAGSYHLWPPGHWLPAPDTAQAATGAVADAFGLALRLASPFIIAGIVWQIALGLIARLVPHLQVYFIAMPGQILGGLALLGLLGGVVVGAWLHAAGAAFSRLPGL